MRRGHQPDQIDWRARPATIQKPHIQSIGNIYLEFFEENVSTPIEELRSVQDQSSSTLMFVLIEF